MRTRCRTELDILDVMLRGVAPCVLELLVVRINTQDVSDRLCQADRDGPSSAAHIENAEIALQVRK